MRIDQNIGQLLSLIQPAGVRSNTNNMFNEADALEANAFNQPAPQMGSPVGGKDVLPLLGAVVLAKLLGASGRGVASGLQGFTGARQQTAERNYANQVNTANQKTKGQIVKAGQLRNRAEMMRGDQARKEETDYRNKRASVSDSQWQAGFDQSGKQFGANMNYRQGRDVKDDAFRDTAFKYSVDRDQKLDTAAAEESKWKREIWQKEFDTSEARWQKEFKRLEARDRQSISEFKANLKLGYAQLSRRASEFNQGMTLDRDKFTWQKEIAGDASKLKAAEGAFDKVTANLKKVDVELERLMKMNDAEIAQKYLRDPLRGFRKVEAPSAGMASRLTRIEQLKARQAQLIEELNKTSAAAGFAPVGGANVKENNGTLDFGDGVTSTRVK